MTNEMNFNIEKIERNIKLLNKKLEQNSKQISDLTAYDKSFYHEPVISKIEIDNIKTIFNL
jgi:hypothetical protein